MEDDFLVILKKRACIGIIMAAKRSRIGIMMRSLGESGFWEVIMVVYRKSVADLLILYIYAHNCMPEPIMKMGNAGVDGEARRGWFFGHFIPEGPLHSTDVELKWGVHPAGEKRESFHASDPQVMTLAILIKGKFKANFEGKEFLWKEYQS